MARKATIQLYGEIFDWSRNSALEMIAQIERAATGADEIELHVHCYGGSVIEGNMIYNAIKKSQIPVDAYIDGVAASMAPIVLMASRKIYMSENAFIMLHAPAGSTAGRGTAEEHAQAAKSLGAMEGLFIKAVMSRTGAAKEQVQQWMRGDNWFSAAQALKEGLIDGIVDPIANNIQTLTSEDVNGSKIETIYDLYTATLCAKSEIHKPNNINQINQMDKAELITALGLSGVTANSTDAEVQQSIVAQLATERAAREEAQRQLKEHSGTQISAMLDSVKEKITADQRTQFQAIGEKLGVQALEAVVAPIRDSKSFSAMLAGAEKGSPAAMSASWTFEDWQTKDPAGLERMACAEPDNFAALYKAQFGVDISK